jgi:hypothetical protein
MKTILNPILAFAVWSLVTGWALMITVGVIHGEWLPMLPTIGYFPATLVAIWLGILSDMLRYQYEES